MIIGMVKIVNYVKASMKIFFLSSDNLRAEVQCLLKRKFQFGMLELQNKFLVVYKIFKKLV